jgi:hypothetical protein
MSKEMWLATLRHTEMTGELAALRAVVSSAAGLVLGRSPNNIAHAEVVGELVAEFQKKERHLVKLEWPTAWICDLLLGPLLSWVCLANHLDKAARQLREELAWRQEVEVELEALWSSAARVWDMVLGDANGSSMVAMSMFSLPERHEGRSDAAATNGVRW